MARSDDVDDLLSVFDSMHTHGHVSQHQIDRELVKILGQWARHHHIRKQSTIRLARRLGQHFMTDPGMPFRLTESEVDDLEPREMEAIEQLALENDAELIKPRRRGRARLSHKQFHALVSRYF